MVPDEEHEFLEGPKLGCPMVACAIGVFAGPEAEVESQLEEVVDVLGRWFRGGVGDSRGHDGLDDAQGGGVFLLDGRRLARME